jgi:hypothetical protein
VKITACTATSKATASSGLMERFGPFPVEELLDHGLLPMLSSYFKAIKSRIATACPCGRRR